MGWLAAASLAGPVLGSLIGNAAAKKDREAALAMAAQRIEMFRELNYPEELIKPLLLKDPEIAGIYDAILEAPLNDIVSAASTIKEDPNLRDSQLKALSKFGQQSETGMDAQTRKVMEDARRQVQTDVQGQVGSQQQRLKEQGMGTSGAAIMAGLLGTQAMASRENQAAIDAAALNAQLGQQALDKYAQMASSVRGQDFDIAKSKADSLDTIARFNQQNKAQQLAANTAEQREASRYNLGQKQQLADRQWAQYNQELMRQNEQIEKAAQYRMQRAQGMSGGYAGMSDAYSQAGQQKQNMWTGLGQAAGGAASSYGAYTNQQNANLRNQWYAEQDLGMKSGQKGFTPYSEWETAQKNKPTT